MHDSPSARLGIVRPPQVSSHPLVAEIEAAVLTNELTRRLGPVTLDLRTASDAIGPWLPRVHAAWPAAIDVELDASSLWSGSLPLTAPFARTVEPMAAEVRARMLAHLGLIEDGLIEDGLIEDGLIEDGLIEDGLIEDGLIEGPIGTDQPVLDSDRLAALDRLALRPTDLWLIARAAPSVATGDPALDALVTPSGASGIAELDRALDVLVAGAGVQAALAASAATTVRRLQGTVTALRQRVAALEADAQRDTVETTARLDELVHERAVLLERLERAELDLARSHT